MEVIISMPEQKCWNRALDWWRKKYYDGTVVRDWIKRFTSSMILDLGYVVVNMMATEDLYSQF
jgi:hypothetical protein